MIVCLCHRISDRDIHREVRGGTACFEQLQDDTRVASSCGACHDCAREVFDEARAAHGACGGCGAGALAAVGGVGLVSMVRG
ncbi:MAG: (2Fe-2S)-binding protein [Burkholderiaceae bacterium]|nr:(2Fe-2S)-binding protein [Rhodoferax sp.]MCP5286305.1 (2Fe-2S)-binding protein [Burkholderiaceae bacterium]